MGATRNNKYNCCAWATRSAILFGLLAVALQLTLPDASAEEIRYEALTLLLGPFVQVAWKLGLMQRFILTSIDHTEIPVIRGAPSLEYYQKLQAYEPNHEDVFLVTFPKSGTHMLAQMTLQVIERGELTYDNIHQVLAVVEVEQISPNTPNCPPDIHDFFSLRAAHMTRLNVYYSHLTRQHIPYSNDARYIIMMRNPLDVIVSGVNMLEKMVGPRLMPGLDTYMDLYFSKGRHSWAQFYRAWWDAKDQDNVLFLFYEDALENSTDTIVQITEFLDMEVDIATVEKVKHLASLEYMKPNKDKFEPPACATFFPIQVPKSRLDLINKGTTGRGKASLPASIKARVKAHFTEAFADSDFPLERYL